MVSLTLTCRQTLGEWVIVGVVTETYHSDEPPAQSRTVCTLPLTEFEWNSDPLSAVLSAVLRWSGMTMEDHAAKR